MFKCLLPHEDEMYLIGRYEGLCYNRSALS